MRRCTAAVATAIGIVECDRTDGRRHTPPHHHDEHRDGALWARIVWYDDIPGWGSIPAGRLHSPLTPPRPR